MGKDLARGKEAYSPVPGQTWPLSPGPGQGPGRLCSALSGAGYWSVGRAGEVAARSAMALPAGHGAVTKLLRGGGGGGSRVAVSRGQELAGTEAAPGVGSPLPTPTTEVPPGKALTTS